MPGWNCTVIKGNPPWHFVCFSSFTGQAPCASRYSLYTETEELASHKSPYRKNYTEKGLVAQYTVGEQYRGKTGLWQSKWNIIRKYAGTHSIFTVTGIRVPAKILWAIHMFTQWPQTRPCLLINCGAFPGKSAWKIEITRNPWRRKRKDIYKVQKEGREKPTFRHWLMEGFCLVEIEDMPTFSAKKLLLLQVLMKNYRHAYRVATKSAHHRLRIFATLNQATSRLWKKKKENSCWFIFINTWMYFAYEYRHYGERTTVTFFIVYSPP